MLRRTSSAPPRQGVVLLVVLVMLTLFAAVGVAFVTFSESQANSAGNYLKKETDDRPDPDLLLSFVLNQVVFDTARTDSALQTHGLLTGVYGTSGNTPFNGIGRLHTSGPGLDAATFTNFQGRTYSELANGSLNPPYTYADHNSAWLGALQYDPITAQGVVIERSFVRSARSYSLLAGQGSFNPYGFANYNFWLPPTVAMPAPGFDTTGGVPGLQGMPGFANLTYDQRRSLSLRPGPWDHPNFPPPDDFGGDVKNLPPGFVTQVPSGTIPPTTAIAKNDSYWVDVGFPIITDSTGRRFKPLAAFFITDLDNRINLNVHGNSQMTLSAAGTPIFNGHASNQGWGSHEVNVSRVLALNEWENLFYGLTNAGATNVAVFETGRYGRRDAVTAPIAANMVPHPGLLNQFVPGTYQRPRYFSQIDYDARLHPQLLNPVNPPLDIGTTGGITMNRSGALASPGNPFGFAFPGFPFGFDNSQPAVELINHPMLAPIMLPYAAGILGRYADRKFSDAHLEAVLRHGDTGTDGLQSDLRRCLPASVNTPYYRMLMTTRSYDLVRPGKMPYLHRPDLSGSPIPVPYASRPSDYDRGPNPGEFAQGSRLQFPDVLASPAPGAPPPLLPPLGYPPAQGTEFYAFVNSTVGNQFSQWHSTNAHQRLNLNRYLRPYPHLGRGIDPTGADYLPVPLFNLTTAARRVNPLQYPATLPERNQYRLAQNDRQQLARDIYMKLLGITGAQVPDTIPLAADPPAVRATFHRQLAILRDLAQLAVNMVDYVDEDDINTPFNFYTAVDASAFPDRFNPGELLNPPPPTGTETDPARWVPMYWVFGTELPRVVINEVLTEAQVPTGAGPFTVKVWAELHNTTPVRFPNPPPPANYQPVTASPAGTQTEDSLPINLFVATDPATPNGTGYAPYMVVISATNPGIANGPLGLLSGAPLDNLVGNGNVTGIPFQQRFATQPVYSAALGNVGEDFSTWSGNPGNNQPRFTSTSVASGLVGNRAGSRQYIESMATRDPASAPAAPYPQNQIDGFFLIGPATMDPPPPPTPTTYTADGRDTIHPAGITPPAPASNFLIPQAKANSMPFLNSISCNRAAPRMPFMSYQVDRDGSGNWGQPGNATAFNVDRDQGLTVSLRRLANPYMQPQMDPTLADYNPYITIDYMAGIPVNNIGATFSTAARETTGNTIVSRGKKQPYASFPTIDPNPPPAPFPPTARLAYDAQTPVMNSSMTSHTIGSANQNTAGTYPAFDWLQHLDRQAASPMELLGVSGYRPHELTQRFMDYPVVYTDPGTAITAGAGTLTLTGNADDMRYRGNYTFDWAGATVQVGIGPDAEYPVTVSGTTGNQINIAGMTRAHPAGSPVIVFATATGGLSLTNPMRFNHRAPFTDPLSSAAMPVTQRTNRLHRLFDFIETRTEAAANGNTQILMQHTAALAAGLRSPTLDATQGATLFGKTSSGDSWRIQPGSTILIIPPTPAPAGERAEVVTVLAVNPPANTYTAIFQSPHAVNSQVVVNYVPPRVLVPVLGSGLVPPPLPVNPYQRRTRLELSLLHGNCGSDTAHWEIGVGTTLTVMYSGLYEAQAIVENVTSLPSGNFACDVLLPLPAIAPPPPPPPPQPPVPVLPPTVVGTPITYVAVAPSTNRVPGKLNLNTMVHVDTFRAMCDAQLCNEFNPILWAPPLYPLPPGAAFTSPATFTIPVAQGFSRPPWTDPVTGVAWTLQKDPLAPARTVLSTKLELTDPVNGRFTLRVIDVVPGLPSPGPHTVTFVDDRTGLPLTFTPSANSALTVDNVSTAFERMRISRDLGYDPDGIPGSGDEIPARPFLGYAAGFTAPTAPTQQSQLPNGLGLPDTYLRADPVVSSQRLFEVPGATHSQKATELLSKIGNHITSRSNVFAVWVTIGYFEVGPDITLATAIPANAPLVTVDVSSTFGLRVGQFLVIDRGVTDTGGNSMQEVVRIAGINSATQLVLDRSMTPPLGPGVVNGRHAHPHTTLPVTPDRIRGVKLETGLMQEVGRTEGRFQRHRFFAMVDRTVLDPWILQNRVGDIRAVLGNAALDPRKQAHAIVATLPVQPNILPGLRIVAVPANVIPQLQLGSRVIVDAGKFNEEVVSVLAVDPVANTFVAMFGQAHPAAIVGNPITLGFPDMPPPVVHWSIIE